MKIQTIDLLGVYTTSASEGGFTAEAHSATFQESQRLAIGKLLNLMAEAKGIEGVIICSQRPKINYPKAKNTKADIYISKLLKQTHTQCPQN